MSAFTHTLSAYEISFRKRRGFISDETIKFPNIEELVSLIISSYHDNKICKNVGYILKLKALGSKVILNNGIERIHITPDSGRRGRPTKMYSTEEDNREPYTFGVNWTPTNSNNVFLYHFPNDKIYCVFHRVGHSGCKTIFMSLCNELLKSKGIIMDMMWIPPHSKKEKRESFDINGIRLIYRENFESSDVADKLAKGRRKERIVNDLRIDLKSTHNSKFKEITSSLKNRLCSKQEILEKINPILNDDYNEVLVRVSFGGVTRTVPWDDIENIFSGFDVTDEVKNTGPDFLNKLTKCSDDYIFELNKGDE